MTRYEYPRVPRTARTQPQQDAADDSHRISDRFSFVATPSEARGYSWQRHNPSLPQLEIPPLPQIPQNVESHQSTHQSLPEAERIDSRETRSVLGPSVELRPEQAAPLYMSGQYDTSISEPRSQGHIDTRTSCSTLVSRTHFDQQGSHDLQEEETSEMRYTQMPTQDRSQQSQRLQAVVGPDANPLSPPTPTKAYIPDTHHTTNMAVLPPPDALDATPHFSPLPQTERGGSWHHSLFSCAEPSICLTSLACPCIVYGRTQYRLGKRSEKQDPTNMLGYSICNGSCVAFGLLCGFNAILASIQKTRVRKSYEMRAPEAGGILDDCLRGVCCCCCSIAQDEKEIRWREEEARRLSGKGSEGTDGGYVPVGRMAFQAPPR